MLETLSTTFKAPTVLQFPTILAHWPRAAFDTSLGPIADRAIAYFESHGLNCDRTRMNMFGYPGILQDLASPPPWVDELEIDEVDANLAPEREHALRPLYVYANDTPIEELEARLVAHHQAVRSRLVRDESIQAYIENAFADDFKKKIQLARCIGVSAFVDVLNAVFDPDLDITPATGAPDLLVWHPEGRSWFFVEVKGPNDSLRATQAAWIQCNWERIHGRFVLFIPAMEE